jgi:MoxR-like ATPase
LRHRLVLSFEAMSDGLTPDQVIQQILQAVPAPDKPLETHVHVSASS